MTKFHGTLAAFGRPSTDGRTLAIPAEGAISGTGLELALVIPERGAVGVIDTLTVDGALLRYSGWLHDDIQPSIVKEIEAGYLVGHIDARSRRIGEAETVLDFYEVLGATLGAAGEKLWPEVSLTIEPEA